VVDDVVVDRPLVQEVAVEIAMVAADVADDVPDEQRLVRLQVLLREGERPAFDAPASVASDWQPRRRPPLASSGGCLDALVVGRP